MNEQFEILLEKEVNIDGATLIAAFPGVGLTSTIAANFIVDALKMDLVGFMLSDKLPPAAVVQGGIPLHPVRLYRKDKLAILLSDFALPIQLSKTMSDTLFNWNGSSKHFKTIITLEGLMTEPTQEPKEIRVFGVGSTDPARDWLKKAAIEIFDHGWITGVSGLLLSEGNRLGRDVVCLLADANAMYPDARSAAKLVETIDVLLPEIELDLKPLYEEAEKIEENIKSQMDKAKELLAARQVPASRMSKNYMYG
ncbi:MAG: PAC2 family protein [Thermoplasmata archaeon]|nr:PAC2 family protein [Thermoplasmata archaeon]